MAKKTKSNWYIAVVHLLTTFAFVGGLLLLFALITSLIYPDISSVESIVFDIIFAIVVLLLIFFGTKYSSNYLKKKYRIKSKKKIINLSSLYLAIIIILNLIAGTSITNAITLVLGLIVFFLQSQKFIKNNSIQKTDTNKIFNKNQIK